MSRVIHMAGRTVRQSSLVLAVLALLLAGWGACASGPSGNVNTALEQAEAKWSSQKPANYWYRLKTICFCPESISRPAVVNVNRGNTVSVVDAADGQPRKDEFLNRANTIDKLFNIVRDAMNRNAAEINVTYDATRGYPTRIAIDFLKNAIDDEITYVVPALEVMSQESEIGPAPIDDLRVDILKSNPAQVSLFIKGGLRDGCTTFQGITTEREGNTVSVYVMTQRPSGAVCTAIYGSFERTVSLGSDFGRGQSYTVKVNDKVANFTFPSQG